MMDLLSLYSDPLGRRYKKKSWATALGITAAKKRVNKAVFGPFRALNPFRQYSNAKKRTLRSLGYNSEIARAYRSGEWGKYAKRKLIGESGMSMIMPFYESQFVPYNGAYTGKQEEPQTGPLNKGIFAKLSKYAAPGAIVGLAALASRKYNLFQKLKNISASHVKDIQKNFAIPDSVSGIRPVIRRVGKKLWRGAQHKFFAKPGADLHQLGADIRNMSKKPSEQLKAKLTPKGTKRAKKPRKESCAFAVMPFCESFQRPYGGNFRQETHERKPGLAAKIIAAGVLGAGAIGGLKVIRHVMDPNKLAVAAEEAKHWAKHYSELGQLATDAHKPIYEMKSQAHGLYSSLNANLAAFTSPLRSPENLLKAEKAAKGVTAKHLLHDIMTGKRHGGIGPKAEKRLTAQVIRGGDNDLGSATNEVAALRKQHERFVKSGSPPGKRSQEGTAHYFIAQHQYPEMHTEQWRTARAEKRAWKPKLAEVPPSIPTVIHTHSPQQAVKSAQGKGKGSHKGRNRIKSWLSKNGGLAELRRGSYVRKEPRFPNGNKIGLSKRYSMPGKKVRKPKKESCAFPIMPFRESLASAISSQASHTFPRVSGAVPSLALHYGMDWAGDETYHQLKKHPKLRRAYNKMFRSKNPKERPGKFASDMASLGGTAAGVHAAEKLTKGATNKRSLLLKLALGVLGHTTGRFAGNAVGNKINHAVYNKHK